MPNQLNVEGELNLTIVSVRLGMHDKRTITFVTDAPYPVAVLRVLNAIRKWTDGHISQEDVIRQIVSDIPHFPVFGDAEEIREYVDCLDGHHVVVDFPANQVFAGRNKHRDTWGHVVFGESSSEINWDGPNGAAELKA